jgi:hypothetical protein
MDDSAGDASQDHRAETYQAARPTIVAASSRFAISTIVSQMRPVALPARARHLLVGQ